MDDLPGWKVLSDNSYTRPCDSPDRLARKDFINLNILGEKSAVGSKQAA